MTAINLLPWRQTQRDLVKRRFLICLAAAVTLNLVTLIIVNAILNHKINQANLLLQQVTESFGNPRHNQ